MSKQKFTLCIIYVSEAVREPVLDIISSTVQIPCIERSTTTSSLRSRCFLLHSFRDIIYNRTSFYIAGDSAAVKESALSLCRKAFEM